MLRLRFRDFEMEKIEQQQQLAEQFLADERPCFQSLLLPDEMCFVEDYKGFFEIHCERAGFDPFGWGDVHIGIRCQIYCTNSRVHPSSEACETDLKLIFKPVESKYSPFSICIEAIRNPLFIGFNLYFKSNYYLELDVCLDHGPPHRNGTVRGLLRNPAQSYKPVCFVSYVRAIFSNFRLLVSSQVYHCRVYSCRA